MSKITFSKQEIYRHAGMWLFLLAFIPIIQSIHAPLASQVIFSILSILNYGIPYYILLIVVLPYFDKNKVLFFFLYALVFFLFFIIDYTDYKIILSALGGYRPRIEYPMQNFIRGTFVRFLFIAIPSTGVFLSKKLQSKTEENIQKEKDILSKELDFLSNQFHSHLTFNFLNFCYRKLQISSSTAADSLITFSDMLHYSLNMKNKEYTLLSKEIEYIENFIEIQKCITNKVFIDFKCEGDTDSKNILPGILSVFIENAFKHGIFNDPNYPVKIIISVNNNILTFIVENKRSPKSYTFNTGIGLENIKQILQIFYKDLHTLLIEANDFNYKSELKLNLNTL